MNVIVEHCAALILYWIVDQSRSNVAVLTPRSASKNISDAYLLEFGVENTKDALKLLQDVGCVVYYHSPLTDGQYRINRDHALGLFGVTDEPDVDPVDGIEKKYPVLNASLIGAGHWAKNVIEELQNNSNIISSHADAGYFEEGYVADVVPAADRMVPLNHNSEPYQEIEKGIAEVYEAFRGANDLDLDLDERDRILQSLGAAKELWKSAQLSVMQVKIGVVMALESAEPFVGELIKTVSIQAIIAAIKSIVKSTIGIDLDGKI